MDVSHKGTLEQVKADTKDNRFYLMQLRLNPKQAEGTHTMRSQRDRNQRFRHSLEGHEGSFKGVLVIFCLDIRIKGGYMKVCTL